MIPASCQNPFPPVGSAEKTVFSARTPLLTTRRVCAVLEPSSITIQRTIVMFPVRTILVVVHQTKELPVGVVWRRYPASSRVCGAIGRCGVAKEPLRHVTPAIPDRAAGVGSHKLPRRKDSLTRARTFKKRSARVNFKAFAKRPTAQHVPTTRYFM